MADASSYHPGDRIRTTHTMNSTWIADTGMDDLGPELPWTAAGYQLKHERTVTAVTGNTIYVDAPFVQALEDRQRHPRHAPV